MWRNGLQFDFGVGFLFPITSQGSCSCPRERIFGTFVSWVIQAACLYMQTFSFIECFTGFTHTGRSESNSGQPLTIFGNVCAARTVLLMIVCMALGIHWTATGLRIICVYIATHVFYGIASFDCLVAIAPLRLSSHQLAAWWISRTWDMWLRTSTPVTLTCCFDDCQRLRQQLIS